MGKLVIEMNLAQARFDKTLNAWVLGLRYPNWYIIMHYII